MFELKNVSASQVVTFNNCQRLWFAKSILKEYFPQTDPQKRGGEIHKIQEDYLNTGIIQAGHPLGYERYVEWMVPHLPQPGEHGMFIEKYFVIDTVTGEAATSRSDIHNLPMIGYIDIGLFGRETPEVWDLKTTANPRYIKTPAELNEDIQQNVYAKWMFALDPDLHEIKSKLLYVKVEPTGKPAPKRVRSTKVHPVQTTITRSSNEIVWQKILQDIEDMKHVAATCASAEEVTPNLNHCPRFGGCERKEACGISARDLLGNNNQKKKKGNEMSFLSKVQERTKAALASAPPAPPATAYTPPAPPAPPAPPVVTEPPQVTTVTAPVAPQAPAPVIMPPGVPATAVGQILPPDAVPRDTIPVTTAPTETEKKKRTRKTKKKGFTLYVNCIPAKGAHQKYVMIEDWATDMLATLNAQVQEVANLPDYRSLPYSEEKSALTHAVSQKVAEGNMPEALVCLSTGVPREIATELMPAATDVVIAAR